MRSVRLLIVCSLAAIAGGCDSGTPPGCTPRSCEDVGKNCGQVADGCGGTLECGSCNIGFTCGAGGVANVCAPGDCVPKTCAEQGKNCGQVSDGCSKVLECGACTDLEQPDLKQIQPDLAGTPDMTQNAADMVPAADLAQAADLALPADMAQAADMVQAADLAQPDLAPPTDLLPPQDLLPPPSDMTQVVTQLLDVKTFMVSGGITLNGAPPMRSCSTSSPATVRFVDAARNYDLSIPVTCDNAFSFSGQVYPGTYKVMIIGTTFSNLPRDSWFVVNPSFTVAANENGLAYDVKTFVVSGGITLNGAPPTRSCSTSSPATVRFVDAANNYDLSIAAVCDDAFSFSGQLYPGTYKVMIIGTTFSNLPRDSWFVVDPSFTVAASQNGLAYDVKTFVVSGGITLNGAPPTRSCSTSSPATVRFVDAANNYDLSISAACDDAFSFTGQLYPGTYKVMIIGTTFSNLPRDSWFVVNPAFTVAATQSGLAYDVKTFTVSGGITLNGAPPTRSCSTSSPATVRFVDAVNNYDLSIPATCDNAFSFSGQLYPGTYRVMIIGTTFSNLPRDSWFVVSPAFTVAANQSGLAYDVKTFVVSGGITLNGAPPMRSCSTSSPATVRFVDAANNYDLSISAVCDSAFSFSGQLYPGTYKVSVIGTTFSNLPRDSAFVVNPSFTVAANQSGLAYDVITRVFAGGITLNGAPPMRSCSTSSPATVRLVDASRGYDLQIPAVCDNAFSFSGQVYPGTYVVSVIGTTFSNLPRDSWYVALPSLIIP